jgi:hypothetical protein
VNIKNRINKSNELETGELYEVFLPYEHLSQILIFLNYNSKCSISEAPKRYTFYNVKENLTINFPSFSEFIAYKL